MKKNILVILTTIIAIVLFSAQLVISNKLATMGADLADMQQETSELTLENEEIRHKIASYSSLLVISSQAEKLGFERASLRYLERPPVAFNQE